jgi:hypothetical protein
MKKAENVISEEIALNELENFVNEWVEKPEGKDKLKDSYPYIFEALMSGNLIIGEDLVPVYNLIAPIKNEAGEVSKENVNFKTRITPTTQAKLAKGLNIANDQLQFALVCISHIIGEPIIMLDKFRKKDYNTIRELSSVFM